MRCAPGLFALYIWWLKHRTLHKSTNLDTCTIGLPELVAPALHMLKFVYCYCYCCYYYYYYYYDYLFIIVVFIVIVLVLVIVTVIVAIADLGKYMNRSTSNSGGSSSGSGVAAGVVGSSVAPPAYGIPFMEQPHNVPTQNASMSQGDLHICLLCCMYEPLMPCPITFQARSWFACVSALCSRNSGMELLLCHIVAFTVHSPCVDLLAYLIVMP